MTRGTILTEILTVYDTCEPSPSASRMRFYVCAATKRVLTSRDREGAGASTSAGAPDAASGPPLPDGRGSLRQSFIPIGVIVARG
jgi:hypothetical protein